MYNKKTVYRILHSVFRHSPYVYEVVNYYGIDSFFNDLLIAQTKYDPIKYPNTKEFTFLYKYIKNRALTVLKQMKKRNILFTDLSDIDLNDIHDCAIVDSNLIRKNQQLILIDLMKRANLSDFDIKILRMRYVKSMTLLEIIETLNLNCTKQYLSYKILKNLEKIKERSNGNECYEFEF